MRLTMLGKELRKMRIEKDLSLRDMASKIKIIPNFLSSIETGRKRPTNDFISKICEAYQLSDEEKQKLEKADEIDKRSVYNILTNFAKMKRIDKTMQDVLEKIKEDESVPKDMRESVKQIIDELLLLNESENIQSTTINKTCNKCKHWVKQKEIPGFGYCILPTLVFEYIQSNYPQETNEVVLKMDNADECVDVNIVTGGEFYCGGWERRKK